MIALFVYVKGYHGEQGFALFYGASRDRTESSDESWR